MLGDEGGQATVEAAMLLPAVMLVLALLVQPACLLYTRSVMSGAAAEAVRVLATTTDESSVRDYVLRRLAAVPEVSVFHVDGQDDWQIALSSGDEVEVKIAGHVRPLPLMRQIVSALGESDGGGVLLEVDVKADAHASWVKGGYGEWVKAWG